MGKNKASKKLSLCRQTLRDLSLRWVRGGAYNPGYTGECTVNENTCACGTADCSNMQNCMTLLTVWCCTTVGGAPSFGKTAC